ncbi:hypothetical protein LPB86_02905 [Pedobacter sp. MC2016-14]|uniref:hypothetical protein n=1 Tax=Pedobacter sp. MC2016-14 TaxID=2897327 RepID=UPI001E4687FF|nr:hypothetical protein [Pedobacter sp. MC2016-14]MCD0487160.1 hypothetical protein [Pedobacter sp. MC2016-14]
MKARIIRLLLLFSALLIISCDKKSKDGNNSNSAKQPATTRKDNLNISILLDLSDRIDPVKHANQGMDFYKRDLGYIEAIVKGFETHLRSKPVRQDNDDIQVYFEPEPLNSEINSLAKKLKFSFTKDNTTKASILKISKQYNLASNEIYKLAIKNSEYIGSDIWGFFKNKVNDYCIKSNHRNILFILTDGYVYHRYSKFTEGSRSSYITPEFLKALKLNTSSFQTVMMRNDYGFVKANDNLSDLEVIVLGVNPAKGNPFEGDVINEYWVKWLKEMGVKQPIMKPIPADLPSNLESIIQSHINRNKIHVDR